MTRRRNLESRQFSLLEIREIMNSMKTLAYMETRKLQRFLEAQHNVVHSITDMARDLLSHYPELFPEEISATPALIIIGTERGFCGDFNHTLQREFEAYRENTEQPPRINIVIGHKLQSLFENSDAEITRIDGASVTEDVTNLLNILVTELLQLQNRCGILSVHCIYQSSNNGIVSQKLLPPFHDLEPLTQRYSQPPLLNTTPQQFLLELGEYYLFAALYEIIYASLMAENRFRVAHLEGAVRHLDNESDELKKRINALRQEEIIEEIEVILLSASSLDAN